jgi:DnaJ-domain-containing protein 1
MYHPDKFFDQPTEVRQWAEETSKTINFAYESLIRETKERR